MSTNTFQRRYARLFAASAVVALATTLGFQAPGALAAVGLSILHASVSLFMAVFSGSAALNGTALALAVGVTHMRFWGPAQWDGRNFSVKGKPRLAKWSEGVGYVAYLGAVVLFVSLFFYAEKRSALDSVLSLITLQVVGTILSHKARMSNVSMSIPGGEHYRKDGDFAGEYLVLGIFGVASVACVLRLLDAAGQGPLALGLGSLSYAAAAFVVWLLTRMPHNLPGQESGAHAAPTPA